MVLNANDSRISKLATGVKVKWFGHSSTLVSSFVLDDLHSGTDDKFFEATKPDVELVGLQGNYLSIQYGGHMHEFSTTMSSTHNAINTTAAITAVRAILPDSSDDVMGKSLQHLSPAFGRGEIVRLRSGGSIQLQLVKNPAGFIHGLGVLKASKYDAVAIVIDDDYADGRDVSWLWDVSFADLPEDSALYCGGVRAYDMAVRLKYDGLTGLSVVPQIPKLIQGLASCHSSIIYCTYTAMLSIRSDLAAYSDQVQRSIL